MKSGTVEVKIGPLLGTVAALPNCESLTFGRRDTTDNMHPKTAEKTTTARERKGHQAGGALRAPPACDVSLAVVVFLQFSGAFVGRIPSSKR